MIEEIADISKDYLWGDMVEDIKIMNDKGMLLSEILNCIKYSM